MQVFFCLFGKSNLVFMKCSSGMERLDCRLWCLPYGLHKCLTLRFSVVMVHLCHLFYKVAHWLNYGFGSAWWFCVSAYRVRIMINSASAIAFVPASAVASVRDRGRYKHHTIHSIVVIPTHNLNE